MTRRTLFAMMLLSALSGGPYILHAQVTVQRLLNAAKEPQNWLTYSGTYFSQRYSTLNQITPLNAKNLEQKWVYQTQLMGNWQATPLVVDEDARSLLARERGERALGVVGREQHLDELLRQLLAQLVLDLAV